MSNEKHYPLHPNQSHPPIMTCEIPLEEYESIKRENAELKAKLAEKDKEIARQNEAWNRLCKKYNKFVSLKQEFFEKFKDIELEITK